ncbi:MAG: excinuclease ABC subunit UvrC [Dehalococcoidia bacterium]|nr:excinuclease ABC subunit UvrC [Dehalococcoidia bacterium]
MTADTIHTKLALAPEAPGVYLFRNDLNDVIYVGKAANLRNRVRSYFGGKAGLSTKVLRLVEVVADIEYILAGSEQEALVLESDLIKRYRPQFNARLKDDKSFPFLVVDVGSDWPRVSVTRRKLDNGSVYFGPFASARSMHETLKLIRKTFPLRICPGPLPTNRDRACLNMHIGLCPGPCIGTVSEDEYRRTVDRVLLFLQGRYADVVESLQRDMKAAADVLDFEKAAMLRDRLRAVEMVTHRYEGVTALRGDQDILVVAQDEDAALVDVFSVREGRVLGHQTFPLEGAAAMAPGEVLRSFILSYYRDSTTVPPVLMLQHAIADSQLISGWLSRVRGATVRITTPRRGVRKQIVDNAADSVARQLVGLRAVGADGTPPREAGLRELKQVLGLPVIPRRIEGFDISTLQGAEPVGSMVVFVDGVPKPSEYRRFKIKAVEGQDDFAMLAEVLRRRFTRLTAPSRADSRTTLSWKQPPSLIMVDGGRGQLSAAVAVRNEFSRRDIPMVGLAKEHEVVFVEGSPEPAPFEQDSPALMILQALRDEAHRFAVSYHRRLHGATVLNSILDIVPGIGPRRRRSLMLAYDSIDALRGADAEEIASRCHIPLNVVSALKKRLTCEQT